VAARPGEAFWLRRLKFRTTATHVRFDPTKYGWGWVSDSVSWVIPTAMAIVAVNSGRRLGLIQGREVERRIALASSMLWDRMCPGGGWNAGNSVVYGVPLAPNMEATSISLLAVQGNLHGPEADRSLCWLVAADCQSAYSMAWKVLSTSSTSAGPSRHSDDSRNLACQTFQAGRRSPSDCRYVRARSIRIGARQPQVAIKVAAARFSERLEREARVIASLNHPNTIFVKSTA
jgi:hypothetical protein